MLRRAALSLLLGTAAACSDGTAEVVDSSAGTPGTPTGAVGKGDSSAEAIFLDFEFDAALTASSCWNPNGQIEDQMLFTIGHFNGEGGVGRIDRLDVTNVTTTSEASGCRISYHGRLPVAWPRSKGTPSTYTLKLPTDLRYDAQDRFAKTYTGCVDPHAHDVTSGNFWYYYRPQRSGCKLADADIVKAEAKVYPSSIQTTGKYPEYHKVWEDGRLEVVAIFGKYEDSATSNDAGISAYDRFSQASKQRAAKFDPAFTMEPSDLPLNPGVKAPKFTITAKLPGNRTLQVKAFLVDNVQSAPESFWDEYEALTPTADLIVYNGHAGLGSNVRKLAQKGKWAKGQYAINFQNGCDTYAYISDALADAHAAVNPEDTEGTLHLDTVANAMPSFFASMSNATVAVMDGLLDWERPRTYDQIFANIDSAEVVLVTGEHDNVYVPGYNPDAPPVVVDGAWKGLDEKGTVTEKQEVHFETQVLPEGSYTFVLGGTGDADLYVKLGESPTASNYDCRPYLDGSDETCEVRVTTPVAVHVMVRGYASSSTFALIGDSN